MSLGMEPGTTVRRSKVAVLMIALALAAAATGLSQGEGREAPAAVAVDQPALTWSAIRLRARKFLLSASTELSVKHAPAAVVADELRQTGGDGAAAVSPGARVAVVTLYSSLPFGRREQTTAWLDGDSGAALQTEKLKTGGRPYWKLRRYLSGGYHQWRSEPASDQEKGGQSEHWSRRSERLVQWDMTPSDGAVVTDSYALLYLLAVHRLDRQGTRLRLCVSSETKLIEAEFVAGAASEVDADFEEVRPDGSLRRRKGPLRVRTVVGSGRLLGSEAGSESVDLGLLGMSGQVTVLLEEGTGLPVEVRGHTEDIGSLTVKLDQVRLGSPAGEWGE